MNNNEEIYKFLKDFEEVDNFIKLVNDKEKHKKISAKIFENIFKNTKNIEVNVNINLNKKKIDTSKQKRIKKREGVKRIGNPKFIRVLKKVKGKYRSYTRQQWVSAIQDKLLSDAKNLKSLFYNQANKIKNNYFKNSDFIFNESIEIGKDNNYKLKFSVDLTKLDDYKKLHDLFSDIFAFKLNDSMDIKIENFMEFINDFKKIQANYKVTSHALDERATQRILIPVLEKLHLNEFSNNENLKEKIKKILKYGAYKEKKDEALNKNAMADLYTKIFKELKSKHSNLNKNELKMLVNKEYDKIKKFIEEYYDAVENDPKLKKLHQNIYKDYYKYSTLLKLTLFRNTMWAIKTIENKFVKETGKTFGDDDLKEVEPNPIISKVKHKTKAIGIGMRLLGQNVIAIVRKLKLNNGQYEYVLSTILANPDEKIHTNIDDLYIISNNEKLFEGIKKLKFLKSKDNSLQKLDNPKDKLLI